MKVIKRERHGNYVLLTYDTGIVVKKKFREQKLAGQ